MQLIGRLQLHCESPYVRTNLVQKKPAFGGDCDTCPTLLALLPLRVKLEPRVSGRGFPGRPTLRAGTAGIGAAGIAGLLVIVLLATLLLPTDHDAIVSASISVDADDADEALDMRSSDTSETWETFAFVATVVLLDTRETSESRMLLETFDWYESRRNFGVAVILRGVDGAREYSEAVSTCIAFAGGSGGGGYSK